MTGERDMERLLETWLEEEARPMPTPVLEAALEAIPRASRRTAGGWFVTSPARSRALSAVLATAVILAAVAVGPELIRRVVPAGQNAAGHPGAEWHRVNFSDPPAHERLTCVGSNVWQCRYDQVQEPTLGFGWERLTGSFLGASSACPTELGDLCNHALQTFVGATTYQPPNASSFALSVDLIVTDRSGVAPLYMYINGVACPWFTSFSDALAANPFPQPYDGVNGPAPDCIPVKRVE